MHDSEITLSLSPRCNGDELAILSAAHSLTGLPGHTTWDEAQQMLKMRVCGAQVCLFLVYAL